MDAFARWMLTLLLFAALGLALGFAVLLLNVVRPSRVSRGVGAALGALLLGFALWRAPETVRRIAFVHPTEGHRWAESLVVIVPACLGLANLWAVSPWRRHTSWMRVLAVGAPVASIVGLCARSVTHVDAEHVGVRVFGGRLAEGWVLEQPFGEPVVQYPTSPQQLAWRRSGSDASLTFVSRDGVSLSAEAMVSFHIERSMAPRLHARFGPSSWDSVADAYLRAVVRESVASVAAEREGARLRIDPSELAAAAMSVAGARLAPDGIVLERLVLEGVR